ncbi:MAG: relaxase, partial [Bacteroidales bacterium]|nr:relaxase [Bacteroidales bacterium]
PIEKVVQVGAEVAENISNALGGLFEIGPGYDPEEEAFIRQMKRRKKKKGRSL